MVSLLINSHIYNSNVYGSEMVETHNELHSTPLRAGEFTRQRAYVSIVDIEADDQPFDLGLFKKNQRIHSVLPDLYTRVYQVDFQKTN